MLRILRLYGQALIYVWALEQERNGVKSNYLTKKEDSISTDDISVDTSGTSCGLPVHVNRTPFEAQDVLVPWCNKKQAETHNRFYHVFKEKELIELVHTIPNAKVKESWYDKGNWCVIIEKIALE